MENEEEICIKISLKEYKELLIIKGKYEELKEIQKPLVVFDGKKDNVNVMPYPYRELQSTDPVIAPPYKITCKED